ncbi:CMP-sialic acid transporter-like [Symsagittifera roscoffensis]|uniref:CMP-sialic acid transporter-like n=1 Tax=Symsagittifera roscoffensis TaxID=84072 RepID=UPI00307B873A
MTINIVLVNQSRNINYNDSSKDSQSSMYSASTAVFIVEFAKLTLNIVLLFLCEKSWNKSWKIIKVEFVQNWLETIKCSIPALLYVVQNNLSYIALTYLDPGTFEVTLQIKLLTTAIVMRLLMGKILKVSQWVPISLIGCFTQDSSEIQQLGFFHGYDSRVWLIVFISSVGGLATSVTLKYLDNIYKNFSSSFAIILASLSSIYLSGKQYGCFFFFGSALGVPDIKPTALQAEA